MLANGLEPHSHREWKFKTGETSSMAKVNKGEEEWKKIASFITIHVEFKFFRWHICGIRSRCSSGITSNKWINERHLKSALFYPEKRCAMRNRCIRLNMFCQLLLHELWLLLPMFSCCKRIWYNICTANSMSLEFWFWLTGKVFRSSVCF